MVEREEVLEDEVNQKSHKRKRSSIANYFGENLENILSPPTEEKTIQDPVLYSHGPVFPGFAGAGVDALDRASEESMAGDVMTAHMSQQQEMPFVQPGANPLMMAPAIPFPTDPTLQMQLAMAQQREVQEQLAFASQISMAQFQLPVTPTLAQYPIVPNFQQMFAKQHQHETTSKKQLRRRSSLPTSMDILDNFDSDSPENMNSFRSKQVGDWSKKDVTDWISSLGDDVNFLVYADTLKRGGVDGKYLLDTTMDVNFRWIKNKLHRGVIRQRILRLRKQQEKATKRMKQDFKTSRYSA